MTPREIRKAAGLTIERAAVGAGVTSPTVRMFEASETAVSEAKRLQLRRFYDQLASRVPSSSATSGPVAA